jgi:hypothetical protein
MSTGLRLLFVGILAGLVTAGAMVYSGCTDCVNCDGVATCPSAVGQQSPMSRASDSSVDASTRRDKFGDAIAVPVSRTSGPSPEMLQDESPRSDAGAPLFLQTRSLRI